MSGIAITMSGLQAQAARLEGSQNRAGVEAARAATLASEPQAPVNPMATPVPKVYRPIRARLYSLVRGGGARTLYRQVSPGCFTPYDPIEDEAVEDSVTPDVGAYPQTERLERRRAAVNYRTSLKILEAAAEDGPVVLNLET